MQGEVSVVLSNGGEILALTKKGWNPSVSPVGSTSQPPQGHPPKYSHPMFQGSRFSQTGPYSWHLRSTLTEDSNVFVLSFNQIFSLLLRSVCSSTREDNIFFVGYQRGFLFRDELLVSGPLFLISLQRNIVINNQV